MTFRLLLSICLLSLGSLAGATLVRPVSLDELVNRADLVFEGTVVDVRPAWHQLREGRAILSTVTFRVMRQFKGTPRSQIVLDVFGGTVGKDTMHIAGMPAFAVGDHDVLFVRREPTVPGLPIVGMMQGRIKVNVAPTGVARVSTSDGRAIPAAANVGTKASAAATIAPSMTLEAFAAEITQRVRAQNAGGR